MNKQEVMAIRDGAKKINELQGNSTQELSIGTLALMIEKLCSEILK